MAGSNDQHRAEPPKRPTLSTSRFTSPRIKSGGWSRHEDGLNIQTAPTQVEPDPSDFATIYAARADEFYQQAIARTTAATDDGHSAAEVSTRSVGAASDSSGSRLLSSMAGGNRLGGASLLRAAGKKVVNEKKSLWGQFVGSLATEGSEGGPESMAETIEAMQSNFRSATRVALDLHKGNSLAASQRTSRTLEDKRAKMAERHARRAKTARPAARQQAVDDGSLRAEFANLWNHRRKSSSHAFGGLGFRYDVVNGESAELVEGWGAQVEEAASMFDDRHREYSKHARKVLSECEVRQSRELEVRLFMLRGNRFTVQPLRLDTDQLSPRGHMRREACHNFDAPLALSVTRGGGPLIPVHTRKLATEVYKDEDEDHCVSWLANDPQPEEPEVPEAELIWTLYGSIWGPRCEWCDGLDFVDHDEVIFERFAIDWQIALRLGVARMISDNDEEGKLDEDDDGVPDEVEDVGAVLLTYAQLYTLVYWFYADAIYGGGGDLETGMKENEGWKALSDNIGICNAKPVNKPERTPRSLSHDTLRHATILLTSPSPWSSRAFPGTHLNTAAAASKNNAVFSAVDRSDRNTAGAISVQSSPSVRKSRKVVGGPGPKGEVDDSAEGFADDVEAASRAALEAMNDKSTAFAAKADRQLSRGEFVAALVKLSIERFVYSKQNPKNPLKDVSDALDKLFVEYIEASLGKPLPGCSMPRIPMPNSFRESVCYTRTMSDTLKPLASSLRIIFAGLAHISFEKSRTSPPKLPVPKKSKKATRVDEHEQTISWVVVSGLVSFADWCNFVSALGLKGIAQREYVLSFVYSVMCVIDASTEEGGIKERSLPFEGFLEAIIRLATTLPIPNDQQLADAGFVHAGPYLSQLAELNEIRFAALTKEQACEWGDTPNEALSGSMPRRIEHFVDMIKRRMKPKAKEGLEDEPVGALTRAEFRNWALKAMGLEDRQLPGKWADEKAVGE